MDVGQYEGFNFIAQGGLVFVVVAIILLIMSDSSWYDIVVKAYQAIKNKVVIKQYLSQFWAQSNLQAALDMQYKPNAVFQIAMSAVDSAWHHEQYVKMQLDTSCSHDEFITRHIRRALTTEQAWMESDLSLLATVGSVAPFVGLFGTVWGIYHALLAVGTSGQASIDQVADPVGEALIMTAIGLAVAIPAVLAYNVYLKLNRNRMAMLEHFSQDLHTLLTTGASLVSQPTQQKYHNVTELKRGKANVGQSADSGVLA